MEYTDKLRIVAVIWLLSVLTFLVIVHPTEMIRDTVGLILGSITALIVAVGIQVTRSSD